MLTARKVALATALIALGAYGTAQAATDGSLGATSTGDSTVTLTIAQLVQITGLDDVAVDVTAANLLDPTIVEFDDVCVYSNSTTTRTYSVTATTGTSGVFQVSDGTNTVDFITRFNNAAAAGGTALTPETTSASFANGATATDCGGTPNARFEVEFATADLQAAIAGTYTATLTLEVAPI